MIDQAAVVVVGGGITGVSIAYHLARAGIREVALLEKGELTSGTTFHSAGLVTQFRTSLTDLRLMRWSVELYRAIQAEEGEASGWRPVGSLRLASTPAMLKALRRSAGRARAVGLDVALIGPAEAHRVFPAMTTEGLLGAVHVPGDGYVEPASITAQLARRARALGVSIHTGTLVTGIHLDARGRVAGVATGRGTIRAETVVNAAGQWAPRVARMAGVELPIVPLMHQYLTTRPVEGCPLPRETPVVRDPANLVYLREETGGFLVGGFEPEPRPWAVDGVPWDFSQRLLPPEWGLFEPLLEGATRPTPPAPATPLMDIPAATHSPGTPGTGPRA